MAELLFGMETEHGFAVRGSNGAGAGGNRLWGERYMIVAREILRHLPSADGGGMFIENGARFYSDCGHPEMTTPECANPWDVVRYMLAGERVLLRVLEELQRREPGMGEAMVFKTNVDHGGSGASWGCHTSFMHRTSPAELPEQIIPHLVSRIVYSGAGGVEAAGGKLAFTLSPRVAFIEREISSNSTSDRGIFHTKDETLTGDGYHRLHIICGESLCSETAVWLNMGATALVVAMFDAGLRPGHDVRLRDSVEAMRTFAADPACNARVRTVTGRAVTAVQIQRHYLELAEANRDRDFMPPWAGRVCASWRSILDRLENGAPGSVATTLDWAIKLGIFLNRAERRGIGPEHWCHLNPPQKREAAAPNSAFREFLNRTTARTSPETSVPPVIQELHEIDTRFGMLGAGGIFSALDQSGVLSHRVPGVDNIEHALVNGPAVGRGGLRARCVRRLAGQGRRYVAGWRMVVDRESRLCVDLSDPFATEENWREMPPAMGEGIPHLHDHLRARLGDVLAYHDRGYFEAAADLLRDFQGAEQTLDPLARREYLRLLAWVQSRRGYLDGIGALERMAAGSQMTFGTVGDFVCVYRYQGLVPPREMEPWIGRGRSFLHPPHELTQRSAVPFLGHAGAYFLRHGRVDDALRCLTEATQPGRQPHTHPGNLARALADLGDAQRAAGLHAAAHQRFDAAETILANHGGEGDRADFVLLGRAKAEEDRGRALQHLSAARATQLRLRNAMGEARTLLLQARLLEDAPAIIPIKARLHELRGQRPALSQCRLMGKILDHWETWTRGGPDPDGGADAFWWL
jgi:proteasome accessory factor A